MSLFHNMTNEPGTSAMSSSEAAEADLLDRRIVTIPAKDWERFKAWAARPPREIAALKELVNRSLSLRQLP
jgi:uncharacterized protein (DUF1778 family)